MTLPAETDVSAVEIDANAGYDVEIYVANAPADTLVGWGAPRATKTDVSGNAKVDLSSGASGRYVLVWFTHLPNPAASTWPRSVSSDPTVDATLAIEARAR